MDLDNVSESALRRITRVIQAELAFYPGRLSLIARIAFACTSVMVAVMVFRIPGAALGAYFPLLISRDSLQSTRRSAVRTAYVCILGTAEIILGAMLFAGSPFLHFFWVAGNLFGVFYLISSMEIYDSALALGLLITTAITTWDQPMSADARVRQTLFTLLSILIGCAASVIIEYFFAETNRPDSVLIGIQHRLALVENLLRSYGEKRSFPISQRTVLSRLATKGMGELRERLARSNYEITYKEQLSAAVALSGRLVELAVNLSELYLSPSDEDRFRCSLIASNIAAIHASLAREEPPAWLNLPDDYISSIPLLVEIERNVDLIAQSFMGVEEVAHHHLPRPSKAKKRSIFKDDALTNKEHLRFAIRGALSALACYLLYMSVGWTGLSASIATCILTALTNTGASRHKQLMRFAGVILGACAFGFAAQAILLPQIDSLFTFSLLFASVIAIGAWIGTSSPRIAYCGIQIVLAYDLVNLNRFAINTSLVPARDAVLGIMLGIGAMWLIFDHLWADSSTELAREMFLAAFRDTAKLIGSERVLSGTKLSDHQLIAECERMNRDFDKIRSLVDFSIFESFPKAQSDLYIIRCIRMLLPQLRAALMIRAALLYHPPRTDLDGISGIVRRAQDRSSAALLETLEMIEGSFAGQDFVEDQISLPVDIGFPALGGAMPVEVRLCASLVDITEHLRTITRAL